MTTTFLLIRHGLTDAVGSVLTGTAPGVHLNAAGRAQVERLTDQLQNVQLAAVISSPLERALETAAPIAATHGLDVQRLAMLAEFDVGAWTGATLRDLDTTDGWRRFNRLRSITRASDGELMLDVQRRAVGALLELHAQYRSGIVAAVSHGDVIRAALLFFLGMPIDFVHRLEVSPGRVSVVDLGDGEPAVRQVNGGTVSDIL